MKKVLLILFALTIKIIPLRPMDSSTVFPEGEPVAEKTYHPCWQRLKHLTICPCGTICKHAIKGVQRGNVILLNAHLSRSQVNKTIDGKTLFDFMLEGGREESYPEIYAILLNKGFDSYRWVKGEGPALRKIIDLKNIDMFKASTEKPFENKKEGERYFECLFQNIDKTPVERQMFFLQALAYLSIKNPDIADTVVEKRIARRTAERRSTVATYAFPHNEPTRRLTSRGSVPQTAWE